MVANQPMEGERVRLSACLTFDFDATSLYVSMGSQNPAQVSRGEFGATAMPRILDLLGKYGIGATFFVPGHSALAYPDLVQRVVAEGHEIGHHGYVHENPATLDPAREREVFEKGLEILDQIAGVRPHGYRSPGADFSVHTIDILLEYGMTYDSTLSASDFLPYYIRKGDRWSPTEPYTFGVSTELMEIPFAWHLDDVPHLEFEVGWSTDQSPPSTVLEIWQAEFDYAYDHFPGGVFDLCMHPHVIGRGYRMQLLEKLIAHMSQRKGVVFEPLIDYAQRWRAENPLADWVARTPLLARPPA
jgi:peptidoglycan/xylan/chitin deacetylase (PgdA/CDA1 family)